MEARVGIGKKGKGGIVPSEPDDILTRVLSAELGDAFDPEWFSDVVSAQIEALTAAGYRIMRDQPAGPPTLSAGGLCSSGIGDADHAGKTAAAPGYLAPLPTQVPDQLREMAKIAAERQRDPLNAFADDPLLVHELVDVEGVLVKAALELEGRFSLTLSGR